MPRTPSFVIPVWLLIPIALALSALIGWADYQASEVQGTVLVLILVSAGLAFSGSASNAAVTFDGLSANTVYDARIVLSDFAGRSTTNEFTFDTFDESYFDSPGVKVIEAEDYNYEGGKFQDNPPPSQMC